MAGSPIWSANASPRRTGDCSLPLVRFDAVYYGHFQRNRRRLVDYPNLWAYTRELYQMPGIAQTVKMDHIKLHYYGSHRGINPTGIVPKGPELDFRSAHGRGPAARTG